MKGRFALLLLALLAVLSTTSCGSGPSRGEAECAALLRFGVTTYRTLGAWQIPVRGEPLGRAGFVGCGDAPDPGLGKVTVYAIGNVDHSLALIAAGKREDIVFISRDLPKSEWPRVVREAAALLKCTRPMTFEGDWDFIFTDRVPGDELYDIPVPYRAKFTARSSAAMDPDQWVSWTIRARVTQGTRPVPAVDTAKTAIRHHRPVIVSTTCTDRGGFEVTHLELAD